MMATDFGRDLWCRSTLVTTRMASGVELLVNSLVRRITTPRGRLYFHRNYGIDFSRIIGSEFTPGLASSLGADLEAEIEEDPRVSPGSVVVEVREIKRSTRTDLEFDVAGDSLLGPFEFVTSIDKVTLELLNVRRAA